MAFVWFPRGWALDAQGGFRVCARGAFWTLPTLQTHHPKGGLFLHPKDPFSSLQGPVCVGLGEVSVALPGRFSEPPRPPFSHQPCVSGLETRTLPNMQTRTFPNMQTRTTSPHPTQPNREPSAETRYLPTTKAPKSLPPYSTGRNLAGIASSMLNTNSTASALRFSSSL